MIFVGACQARTRLDIIFEPPRLFHLMPDLEVELYGNTVKRQKDWFINALELGSMAESRCLIGSESKP